MNDIGIIHLDNGGFTLVDSDLMPFLPKKGWRRRTDGYIQRLFWNRKHAVALYLHRLVNCTPNGMDTDHVNRLKWDNRRTNLRRATRSQNNCNAKKHGRGPVTSNFKGVWKTPEGKWAVQISSKGKRICVGTFNSEEEAANAYNAAATKHYGEFAKLNKV